MVDERTPPNNSDEEPDDLYVVDELTEEDEREIDAEKIRHPSSFRPEQPPTDGER